MKHATKMVFALVTKMDIVFVKMISRERDVIHVRMVTMIYLIAEVLKR